MVSEKDSLSQLSIKWAWTNGAGDANVTSSHIDNTYFVLNPNIYEIFLQRYCMKLVPGYPQQEALI